MRNAQTSGKCLHLYCRSFKILAVSSSITSAGARAIYQGNFMKKTFAVATFFATLAVVCCLVKTTPLEAKSRNFFSAAFCFNINPCAKIALRTTNMPRYTFTEYRRVPVTPQLIQPVLVMPSCPHCYTKSATTITYRPNYNPMVRAPQPVQNFQRVDPCCPHH